MAQVNCCLKRLFTVFNVFFAIIGGFIISLALLSQVLTSNVNGGENLEGRTTGLIILYVVGAVTMVIALLGAYGAHKESKVCLSVFLVCMVIGSLLMLRLGIPAAVIRPELESLLEDKFRAYLPLDRAPSEVQDMADTLQSQMHCCGLFSYTDWEGKIPESCKCGPVEEEEGMCRQFGYEVYGFPQSPSIYSRACFPIVSHYTLLVVDIMIGIIFTLAALAVLGMILSSVIIHQIRKAPRPSIMLTIPTIFTASPPKYQELQNPPPPYC